MTEVAIHLEDELIASIQSPTKPLEVSCTKPQLASSPLQVYLPRVLLHLLLNDLGCAVGRAIINNQDMECLWKGKDSIYHLSDVLSLIIGRYYDNATCMHKAE